jgi:hypothetical protein
MDQIRKALILFMAASAVACSKAKTDFELLDQDAIPQPKFSGQTVKNLTASSGSATFNISGECDPKIKSLKARPSPIVSTYASVSDYTVSAPTVNCSSSGTFSFELKSLTALGFTPLVEGHTYEIQLTGMTSAGLSRPSYIRITYQSGAGNRNIWLAAGGIHNAAASGLGADAAMTASGGAFKAQVSINYISKDPTAFPSGGAFKARLSSSGM